MPENDEPLDDARAVAMNAAAAAARVAETIIRNQQNRAERVREKSSRQAVTDAAVARAERSAAERMPMATVREKDAAVSLAGRAVREDFDYRYARTDTDQARAWAKEHNPERLAKWQQDTDLSETADSWRRIDAALVTDWKAATPPEREAINPRPMPRTRKQWKAEIDAHKAADAKAEAAQPPPLNVRGQLAAQEAAAKPPTQQQATTSTPDTAPKQWRMRGAAQEKDKVSSTDKIPAYDSSTRRATADAEMKAAGVPAEIRNARSVSDALNGQDPARAAAAGSNTAPKSWMRTRRPERDRGR